MSEVIPVILAGGTGSRLWPLSRALLPKQFHPLVSNNSLLQDCLMRTASLDTRDPIIVCNEDHRFLVAEHCRQVGASQRRILLEPAGRNTAPAIALAAFSALDDADISGSQDSLLLIMPSDHVIEDLDAFAEAISQAAELASLGHLVTFGIAPTSPETAFGYIEVSTIPKVGIAQDINRFVEKPNAKLAESYLQTERFLWNSGIFLLSASAFLGELKEFNPIMHDLVRSSYSGGTYDMDFFRPSSQFLESPSDSIDYAVMEKTKRAKVIPVDFQWSDVGSWKAVWDLAPKDENANRLVGDVVTLDSFNSLVMADDKMVAAVGLQDMVVIETADAVLVADKGKAQEIRGIVELLESAGREQHLQHKKVFRPWGTYETISMGTNYQVKLINVNSGASLSLQFHDHRSEHWVVLKGEAEVTCDQEIFTLSRNESTYIPLGTVHRLHNPGDSTLQLIEVQVGDYLGEDDIVRLEDDYGR